MTNMIQTLSFKPSGEKKLHPLLTVETYIPSEGGPAKVLYEYPRHGLSKYLYDHRQDDFNDFLDDFNASERFIKALPRLYGSHIEEINEAIGDRLEQLADRYGLILDVTGYIIG